MAEQKKQHYVPQFYLRNFSWGEKRLPIRLFCLDRGSWFTEGNLKNQCYENYFYGKDLVIEKMFAQIEGRANEIVKKVVDDGFPLVRYSEDHDALLTFTLLQHARTKHAAAELDEQVNLLFKAVFSEDERFDEGELENLRVVPSNPTIIPLDSMISALPLAHDLQFKLLINRTKIPFITSDNPVVFRNSFAANRVAFSNIGLASRGLEIVFPLSPMCLLIFYDESCYKVGERKSVFKELHSLGDVKEFNDLQWLNAHESVYFNNAVDINEIDRGYKKSAIYRRKKKVIFDESPRIQNADGTESSFIRLSKPEHPTAFNPSCIRLIAEMTEDERNRAGALYRDPVRVSYVREFGDLVKAGKYTASQFGKFVAEKHNSVSTEYKLA